MEKSPKIRLAIDHVNYALYDHSENPKLYTPGQAVSQVEGFMKGHGTYVNGPVIQATVAGLKEQLSQLVSIKPLKCRYEGEVGDVIVGRILEVQQKRWKVETNSRLDSFLQLAAVNLPGGELRRRSVKDEQMMRNYLKEGDLLSAEVQNICEDGSLSLYTRSLKYGKLSQGILVNVLPSLIRRRKNHFHNLSCGASVILGKNGNIWISPTPVAGDNEGGFTQNLEEVVSKSVRETIARLRNCINALASCKMSIYDNSILRAYNESMKYTVKEMLTQEAIYDIALLTQNSLQEHDT